MAGRMSAAPEPVDDAPPFERRVELVASPGVVVAEVEDCQHHFAVSIHHDGTRVQLDDFPTMRSTGMREGVCWAAQPERIDVATRVRGSSRLA